MHKRWAIWVDIEGFSKLWSVGDVGLNGLNQLMLGIFRIGTLVYPEPGRRLFAHQFGDAFVIVSDFEEASLDRCASIAVALMRFVTHSGCFARAAIAEGEFADIAGCHPREIRDAQDNEVVRMGNGLMTLNYVIGTALVNANKVDKANKCKGSLLTFETALRDRFSAGIVSRSLPDNSALQVIDWIHSTTDELQLIFNKVPEANRSAEAIAATVERYTEHTSPPSEWVSNTRQFNGL